MTQGECLYLLLVLVAFGTFMATVALFDHQYRRMHRSPAQPMRRGVDPMADKAPAQ
jgi:hypothetical protein